MEWVGPLISGAAVVLVAIIEAVAARERKRVKADNQKSDALMQGVQALLRREIIAEYNQLLRTTLYPDLRHGKRAGHVQRLQGVRRERNGGKTGGGPETTAHGAAGRDVTE